MYYQQPPMMHPPYPQMGLPHGGEYPGMFGRFYRPPTDMMMSPYGQFAPPMPNFYDPSMMATPWLEPTPFKAAPQTSLVSRLDDDDEPMHRMHKGSSPAPPPSLERVRQRRAIEEKLRRQMPDNLFTLKCRIYKDELQRLIDEQNQGFPRTYIPELREPYPVLELNNAEIKLFNQIMQAAGPGGDITRQLDKRVGSKYLIDLFHELLNSLTNRLLFLVLVEYRSWFPQDVARQQMGQLVLRTLWPREDDTTRMLCTDYVEHFVIQRTKNFRDVISRVCKREKEVDSPSTENLVAAAPSA